MVSLNYNFISTYVDMHGNMQYFTCKISKFAIEIITSMKRDVEFLLDDTGFYMRRDISMRHDFGFTHMRNVFVYTGTYVDQLGCFV